MQQKYPNKRTNPCEFTVGNMVWLSGKNSLKKQPSKKLYYRLYGPYLIIERIGLQVYRLKL